MRNGSNWIQSIKGDENLKLRIDLKIILVLIIFLFTGQLQIYFVIMFFCFLHELGHIGIAQIFKMKLDKLEILPCGFSSSFYYKSSSNEETSTNTWLPAYEIVVAMAGPIVSLILAISFKYLDYIKISDTLRQEIVYSNILILIFNLLPLYPLDGGRILKNILCIRLGEIKSEYIMSKTSYIMIIILTIISSIAVYYFKNIAIFLVCIFLWNIILSDNLKRNVKFRSI